MCHFIYIFKVVFSYLSVCHNLKKKKNNSKNPKQTNQQNTKSASVESTKKQL